MPLFEHILLALLGSGGAGLPVGVGMSPSAAALGADAIVQPNGGAIFAANAAAKQVTGGQHQKGGGAEPTVKGEQATVKGGVKTRHHRRRHHRTNQKIFKHSRTLQK
jgi:hypothetical protein